MGLFVILYSWCPVNSVVLYILVIVVFVSILRFLVCLFVIVWFVDGWLRLLVAGVYFMLFVLMFRFDFGLNLFGGGLVGLIVGCFVLTALVSLCGSVCGGLVVVWFNRLVLLLVVLLVICLGLVGFGGLLLVIGGLFV